MPDIDRIVEIDRFWSKVDRTGACWKWLGSTNSDGYGQLTIGGRYWRAHRLAWTLTNGEIPEGLVLDHVCRVRSCVNPEHLEVVTNAENVKRGIGPTAINARKQRCKAGHAFDADNTMIGSKGERLCRKCSYRKSSEWGIADRAAIVCGAVIEKPRPSRSDRCTRRVSQGKRCPQHGTFNDPARVLYMPEVDQ